MAKAKRTIPEDRALVLAPTGRDADLASKALTKAGLHVQVCPDMAELCWQMVRGAGMALITDEALTEEAQSALQAALAKAPAWSDLPMIILTMTEGQSRPPSRDGTALIALGNVTFLERPIRSETLVTAVQSALRARRRQYEVRELLREQQTAVERMDLLADVASHLLLSHQPEGVVASVFRKIAAHLQLEIFLCFLYDPKRQALFLSNHSGLPVATAGSREWIDQEESSCRAVAQRQKRIVLEQVQTSKDPAAAHLKAIGIAAYACFPLVANGHLIGTLSFGVRQRERLQHEELAMLESVCNQVAVAIERKRTEEALQELNQRLEKRVDERTAQLQEINEQMEAFTYSISHDLRAPLRAIRGFAQALTEDYGAAFDKPGRDYLRRMSDGAQRMDRLIQDLLQYSRLSRSTLTFEPVDLQQAVARVLAELEPEIRATNATVDVAADLPAVMGHEATLNQILVNLLSNAMKFVAPGVKPRIRISGSQEQERVRLWVADNGIGIAPAHHRQIFGVFDRLHGSDVYPGTGIGLAIVAKGIARMGGNVGIESAEGQGSRFWIELAPAPKP